MKITILFSNRNRHKFKKTKTQLSNNFIKIILKVI